MKVENGEIAIIENDTLKSINLLNKTSTLCI